MSHAFPCYLIEKSEAGVSASLTERTIDDLPPGDTLIQVGYSSLNYKDALAVQGHPGVVSKFPHVPGIDAAGVVESCSSGIFQPGDEVIVTGYGLGDEDWGGYAGYIRVPAEWVVSLPVGLSLFESMIYGTAGFTAARGVDHLRHNGVMPDCGEIVVTGATGGVGSLAVTILAHLGYDVVAVTGKTESHDFLRELGAKRIISREEVNDTSNSLLLKGKWAGAVDTVGGNILATIIRSAKQHATVTCCGLVAGAEFAATVYPFILRGVRLVGIDSDQCPMLKRRELWSHMASDWRPPQLESLARTVTLDGLPAEVQRILKGGITGRVVVQPVRD
ncbi:MAG: YhdH/YhfP family quinone oxidoreductase [Pirellulales bacterium]|nr:YhdH/YhfP family quinone oxidoreductase [Pirellulales bacterium]